MSRLRKPQIKPVPADVIADIAAKLAEEAASHYRVASNLEIDWCPCCGINIRMRDGTGALFAKFICTPEVARIIGGKLLAVAHRAELIQTSPDIQAKAMNDVLALAAGMHPQREDKP